MKNKFTLIELLVIITVIGILTSLLTSAMKLGIDKSKDIHCRGQLADKGKALAMYGADNNNNLPRGKMPNQGNYDYWLNAFSSYLGYRDVLDPQAHNGQAFYPKYLCLGIDVSDRYAVPEVLRCPFRPDDGYMGYGWNADHVNWRSLGTRFNEEGGGLTVVHAGGTSFPEWKEYHQIVGATWGKGSGHGPVHEFDVKLAEPHIITQGMEDFRINEELWHTMQVNGDIRVLATAFSPKDKRGSGKEEPVMFVTEYGNGRCFNLVLGAFAHTMKAAPEFEKLLLRGSEWAATGAIAD